MNKNYCYYCDRDVEISGSLQEVSTTIKGYEIVYMAKIAVCKECGNEVDVPEWDDENILKANEEYRKAAGIIAIKDIYDLLKKYNIGKKPLSKLLGWSEVTIDRYLKGVTPLREYSDKLLELKDPAYMEVLLKENRSRITPIAAKKVEVALNTMFDSIIKKSVDVFEVAKAFQSKIDEEAGSCITPLKMQKLIYFAQGWHLAFFDTPLFKEPLQAWVHGPVSPKIYSYFQEYKYNNIDLVEYDLSGVFDNEQIELIDGVYNIYGAFDAKVLEKMTHYDEPWKAARKGYEPNEHSQEVISEESIKVYFKTLRKVLSINIISDIRKALRVYPDIFCFL
jgi:uncharacterized phage-associated protein